MPCHGKLNTPIICTEELIYFLLLPNREIMQEWVETLRSKLREMKILSPRENLYTKLPEVRAPLLPTRDPTSPLPAPPPVPAAIVPGIERIPAHQHEHISRTTTNAPAPVSASATAPAPALVSASATAPAPTPAPATPPIIEAAPTATLPATAMSNTLTQHLLNMLSDPISTYSEQISETATALSAADETEQELQEHESNAPPSHAVTDINLSDDEFLSPILRNGVRVDVAAASAQRISAGKCFNHTEFEQFIRFSHLSLTDQILNFEQMLQCERLIPR